MRPMRSPVRLAFTLALVGVALTSCSFRADSEQSGTRADCAAAVLYGGHTYWGYGELKRDPATTGRLVGGVIPGCDDSGGQVSGVDERVQLSELVDVPLKTAVLLHGDIYVRGGQELPAVTRPWFRAPLCTSDGEFGLTADWLGVTGPKKPRFDGDLRPPYRLDVHVTDGPAEYVGTRIQVHADAATEPGLGPRDVKASLWKGGKVTARVRCVDDRFQAVSLNVP